MNNIIELSADDILMVSGGGNSGDHDHYDKAITQI